MSITETISRHLVRTSYEDLPPEAVAATKQHILHTLATIMGGSAAPGCPQLVDLVRSWAGREESTVLVHGHRAPAPHAVLANSTMAHALDFCCNDDRIAYKSSVCAVPAALALAEGQGASGKALITATCLGIDLGIRIGLNAEPKPQHIVSPVVGPFASAAAASKLLGLSEEGMASALGIALSECRGSGTSTSSPALTKRLGPGLAAQGGVTAALLAANGFPAQSDVFEGPRGYYQTYHRREGDLEGLVAGLGQTFEVVNVWPKPYPSCRYTHASINAALLLHQQGIRASEIAEVRVHLCPRDDQSVGRGRNPEAKVHPRGVVDAQFSVPWTVATALVKGRVSVGDMLPEALANPDVHRFTDKVTVVVEPELDVGQREVKPAIVEVRMRNGQTYSQRVDFPRGSPEQPVTADETRQVFRDCAAYAARPLSPAQVEEAIALVDRLETVENVSLLVKVLV
ncbi:MAG: MmgE/PrpD family protein [Chloroflexi bacterium]|nr:MmgE/PrpD family protein [Chloroflexota bacterium]